MGLFWDLLQHSAINEQRERATTLEGRVQQLEDELRLTREVLHEVVKRLEQHLSEDIDRDGTVG